MQSKQLQLFPLQVGRRFGGTDAVRQLNKDAHESVRMHIAVSRSGTEYGRKDKHLLSFATPKSVYRVYKQMFHPKKGGTFTSIFQCKIMCTSHSARVYFRCFTLLVDTVLTCELETFTSLYSLVVCLLYTYNI